MANKLSWILSFRLSLAILLAGLLTGSLYYTYIGNKAEEELTRYTNTLIENFSSNLALHLWNFDIESLEQISNTLLESRAATGIKIANERHKIIFEAGEYLGPSTLRISQEIRYQKEYVGNVEIFFSIDHVKEAKSNAIIITSLIIVTIILFFVPLMNLTIKRLVTHPIQVLVGITSKIGKGEFNVAVSTDSKNEIGQLFQSFNKMTERLRETAMKQAEAETKLKQSNAELEEFAYRTSHDLRSPLVSSIGLLKITKEAIHSDNKNDALETITLVQKSLQKLENLIKDILVLTKTNNEKEDSQIIDIENLLKDTLVNFSRMDNFERLEIQKSLGFKGELITKKNRFILILENLISNAIKYQDTNKENSFIRISTYSDNNNDFVLEVQDNGFGIPKNQQNKLFTMFKRFHPKISFGSGLGLYMVKKSVDVIGGKLSFIDSGEGSIFRLIISLQKKQKRYK